MRRPFIVDLKDDRYSIQQLYIKVDVCVYKISGYIFYII